jgi:hypothetical protein
VIFDNTITPPVTNIIGIKLFGFNPLPRFEFGNDDRVGSEVGDKPIRSLALANGELNIFAPEV